MELKVHIAHDQETGIWYISESDIPGLRLEAPDAPTLISRISEAAPEMIELNAAEIVSRSGAADSPKHGITPVFDSPMTLAMA